MPPPFSGSRLATAPCGWAASGADAANVKDNRTPIGTFGISDSETICAPTRSAQLCIITGPKTVVESLRKSRVKPETGDLAHAIRAGDRRALARAVTLVESTRSADRDGAERLLTSSLPRSGKAMRIGISGAPGVGKSTFIEAFGAHITKEGSNKNPLSLRAL